MYELEGQMGLIYFRLLEEKDFPQMLEWLNTDFVKQFWKEPYNTVDDIKAEYGGYVTGEQPTTGYIIMINGVDVGYIQTYYYSDWQDDEEGMQYFQLLDANKYSAGVDLFIGHRDYIHKGYGSPIMNAFITEYIFSNLQTTSIIITPEPDNAIAIKVYERIGFKWYKTIITSDGEQEYLMVLQKENFLAKIDTK